MSQYSRQNPDEPPNHDWFAGQIRTGVRHIETKRRIKPSPKQTKVLEWLKTNPKISLADAVSIIGQDIYTNERFHVGNILANMVKRGLIVRVKPGWFTLPNANQA